MKLDEIREIVKMMSEHDLTEFKIESEDTHLCLRRGTDMSGVTLPQVIQAPMAAAPAATAAVVDTASSAPAETKETIDSPIVGTFYRASSPESDAFVEVGTKVGPDTIVCIVEAMKVMNEIKAEKSGVIKEVLVDNAQAVEFGQPLFVIE